MLISMPLSSSYHPRCEFCKLQLHLIRISEAFLTLLQLISNRCFITNLSEEAGNW